MKNEFTIGVLGGMGTYATINLFKQYAEVFSAEKEWERPRIIIDNRCTMPSRVRAFLYNENVDELVTKMCESIRNLIMAGSTKIILACNTSHLFLDRCFTFYPECKPYIVNIIEECVKQIKEDDVKQVSILGSEATIESRVYQNLLDKNHISYITPNEKDYLKVRKCIEAVKQNKYNNDIEDTFIELIGSNNTPCILGCTELPVLQDKYISKITSNLYDPCLIVFKKLKEIYDNE